MRSEVLLVGGRSGVGKSTAAIAVHDLLRRADVPHAVIEGDTLDLAHPAPHLAVPEEQVAERNLADLWARYRRLGHHRLVYTNTMSVLHAADLAAAMGDRPRVVAVLLTAADGTTADRLRRRAGEDRPAELAHSGRSAALLDREAPGDVVRVRTDGRTPEDVAGELVRLAGWARPRA